MISLPYLERLTGESIKVDVPESRAEAKEVWEWLVALAEEDHEKWRAAFRMHTATSLYLMGLVTSWCQDDDPFYGRLEVDCDFQWEYCWWVQFHSDDVVDTTARQHFKSTWRHVRCLQELAKDPDACIGIFSMDYQSGSLKHLNRIKQELESNEVLKAGWPDVFWKNPRKEASLWNAEKGLNVKRRGGHISPSLSAYTFVGGSLPVGSRFKVLYFDDLEETYNTRSAVSREQLISQFRNALNLGGRKTVRWIPGTFHHESGLLKWLVEQGWQHHALTAEDTSKPPPDIAKLYDRFEGVRPDTGAKIPDGVRDIRLEGEPRFLHPLECAIARFEQGHEVYQRQNMADPFAGVHLRFRPEWVSENMRIQGPLRKVARGCNLYIVSDPSRGIRDAQAAWVIAADAEERLLVVDGFRDHLEPMEWCEKIYHLALSWGQVSTVVDIRVEAVGQSTWDWMLRQYFQNQAYAGPPVYGIGEYRGSSGNEDNPVERMRAWVRLQPLFSSGKIRLPTELIVTNKSGKTFDLIDYFVRVEYLKFPQAQTKDLMDALALIRAPVDKAPEVIYPVQGDLLVDLPREPAGPWGDETSWI